MKHLLNRCVGASVLVIALATAAQAQAPKLITTTFLGGAGNEAVGVARIAGDGSIVAVVATYNRVASGNSVRWQWVSSQLVRLGRDADRQLWSQPLPEPVESIGFGPRDDIYALGRQRLMKFKLADGSADGATAAFGAEGQALSLNPDGSSAVLAGGKVVRFAANLEPRGDVSHGIQVPFSVLLDREGGFFVSGDANPGTGCEPYRVPIIRHFNAKGERDWRFYDYPGQLARLEGSGFESDSSIRGLTADARGRLWFRGWSDGLNTMLRQKVWNPKEQNPFIHGACFPGVCPYPRGARSYMMVGRLLDTYNEVGAATWWQAADQRPTDFGGQAPAEGFQAWLEKFALCGCRPHPYATSTSAFIDGVGFHGSEVAIWGSSDKYAPSSADAWWGKIVNDGSVFVGVLDEKLARGRFGAAVPGTLRVDGPPTGDLRGGRLLVAGGATETFPAKAGALQGRFGGGSVDGFLLLACIGSDADCAGPVPPLPVAAPPMVRPEPPLPTLSRCSKENGKVVSARVTEGMLPNFGVDYSAAGSAGATVDGGAPRSTVDGGAALDGTTGPAARDAAATEFPADARGDMSGSARDAAQSAPEPAPPGSAAGCSCALSDDGQSGAGGALFVAGLAVFAARRRRRR